MSIEMNTSSDGVVTLKIGDGQIITISLDSSITILPSGGNGNINGANGVPLLREKSQRIKDKAATLKDQAEPAEDEVKYTMMPPLFICPKTGQGEKLPPTPATTGAATAAVAVVDVKELLTNRKKYLARYSGSSSSSSSSGSSSSSRSTDSSSSSSSSTRGSRSRRDRYKNRR